MEAVPSPLGPRHSTLFCSGWVVRGGCLAVSGSVPCIHSRRVFPPWIPIFCTDRTSFVVMTNAARTITEVSRIGVYGAWVGAMNCPVQRLAMIIAAFARSSWIGLATSAMRSRQIGLGSCVVSHLQDGGFVPQLAMVLLQRIRDIICRCWFLCVQVIALCANPIGSVTAGALPFHIT